MLPAYDRNNVFAKILRGEIPANIISQNDHAIAFEDIMPQAKIHILVIPKKPYISAEDFYLNAPNDQQKGFHDCILQVMKENNLDQQSGGCRLISNIGNNGGQEVPHYHVHILGGEKLGPLHKR